MRRTFVLAFALFLTAPTARAADAELGKILENLAKMVDLGNEIDRYAIGHAALPRAKTPGELSRALLGSESMTDYMIDPWGTPYAIDSDPGRGSYTIVSAGSDRAFDRATWSQPAKTSDPAADTVLKDGELVRSARDWAVAEFKKSKSARASELAIELDSSNAMTTRVDARLLVTALDEYKSARGHYPQAVSSDEVLGAIAPYGHNLPHADAWGTPFRVVVSKDGTSYQIVSAGADRKFDADLPAAKEAVTDYAKDLVLVDGDFVRDWQKPAGERAASAWAGLITFEARHASLRSMPPEEKKKLRHKTLLSDSDSLWKKDDMVGAIGAYETLEKLEPGFVDLDRLTMLAAGFNDITLSTLPSPPPRRPGSKYPEPPPPPKPEHVMTPAERTEAANRIAATLRRVIAASPDEVRAVDALARLEVKRGRVAEGEAVLQAYQARHPRDAKAGATRLDVDRFLKRPVDLPAREQELVRMEPTNPEVLLQAARVILETVTSAPPATPDAKKRAWLDLGIQDLDRAIALKPDDFSILVYQGLLYGRRASLETDPKRAEELKAKAAASDAHAMAIMKAKPRP